MASRELEIVGKMLNWTVDNLRIRGLSGEFAVRVDACLSQNFQATAKSAP